MTRDDAKSRLDYFIPVQDECLVHRYIYYCLCTQVIPDSVYDEMERQGTRQAEEDHPIHQPGSSLEESYPEWVKIRARALVEAAQ